MINTTVIKNVNHTRGSIYQDAQFSKATRTSSSLAANTKAATQEMCRSLKQIQADEDNRFELTVDRLFMQINKENRRFNFKFDKWKQMEGEPIQRNLIRKTDGKGSNPDAEAYYNGKILCIDAKNYSKAKIDLQEVMKLVGDTQVRGGCPGILVLQESSCLTDIAYKECMKRHVAIVQLESIPTKKEHSTWDMNYLNKSNRKKLEKALDAQFTEVPELDVLFTNDGYVDKRSKAWRNGAVTSEQLEEYGVKFREGTKKVDKRCSAFKKYKKLQHVLQQQKKASNYSHETATEEYEERMTSSTSSSSYCHSNVPSNPTGPMKSDGKPDMRYSRNRRKPFLKKSGAPDMRFKCNK